jgi:hypothetical protein
LAESQKQSIKLAVVEVTDKTQETITQMFEAKFKSLNQQLETKFGKLEKTDFTTFEAKFLESKQRQEKFEATMELNMEALTIQMGENAKAFKETGLKTGEEIRSFLAIIYENMEKQNTAIFQLQKRMDESNQYKTQQNDSNK